MSTTATVEFCGQTYPVAPGEPFIIGRDGPLAIDDNPYLHRAFLQISDQNSMWWLTNVGSLLTATVADEHGMMQAWLAPGAWLPLVFERSVVWFTAGSTTYEVDVALADPPFTPLAAGHAGQASPATIGRTVFTTDQKRLILALCEPTLRRGVRGSGSVPTSAQAAARLGWALTRFNRKLDNVCDKLARVGIRGLHGEPGRLAVNRRARLVEYALAARLVQRADLELLDHPGVCPTDKDDQ
ncbi:hypothetical protein Cme02nite_54930 [Catellatospora methionotrophica]|uniref:Uncharacterized protein n=1 Tax=Catellatospora methionotrophica TaxID=121620 RepID=A0A8J3PGV0_9ACTN|nr:hypothetical protein [Catellatospora methionotrophica]GIG17161.1 hypothetical protein Cme02nite_54930 [Catellatospora methionotrophica]